MTPSLERMVSVALTLLAPLTIEITLISECLERLINA